MKNKGMYRLLSGVLCTSVLLSSQAYAAASADYFDFPQNWSKDAMEFAVKNNFITGVGEDKIAPKAALTRAQLAAILSRVMQTGAGDVSVLDSFTDADKNAWYAGSMAKAVELNIFYGDGDSIYPDRPVTRQELFTILVRAFSVTGGDESTLASYNDAGSISSWAKAAISAMIAQGYAAGYEDKTLRPAQQVTREEFAQLLHRMREHYSSSDTSEDKTETKTDDTAKTDETTKTNTKKPSGGGGGGSSSGGGSHGGGSVTVNKIVDETKAIVQTTDMGAWLPLVFTDSYTVDTVASVKVGDTDVTAALSKVTTDGTIAKLPLTGKPDKVVITAKDGKTQTITLNGTDAAAVYTGTGKYLPDYILTHGPVAVWDYHLTNYDKEGNVRVNPAKTTFSLTEEANAHPYYSPDAELITDESDNISGNVTIMFNYNTNAEKEWFNGIKQLQLVQYDETRRIINENLTYTSAGDVAHYNNKVGELTIPIGQKNFRSNGRYYVRVKSTGGDQKTALVPIHVVNYTAPELELKGTPKSGKNLYFNVKNMTYGITNPIESVTLTDPTGATKTLRSIDDYALIGDLFVLYNDVTAKNGVNNLPYNDNYTITIHSNGFKTFSKTFNVTGGEEVPTKQAVAVYQSAADDVDVVTHATGGSSGGGSSSGGSGSYMISADLLFQSDLLVNALLLNELDVDCAAAEKVVAHWNNVSYDAVFNQGGTTYYTHTGYLNAVNTAKVRGAKWLSFGDYLTKENPETTPNRSPAVKEVLEDGLLGDIQHSDTYGRLEAPQATVGETKEGQDVVLTFKNAGDYMGKISKLYLNSSWQELSEDAYEISDNTITIKAGALKIGENKIVIDADGYMSNVISIDYEKKTEKDLSLSVATPINEGQDVVITVEKSEGDFLKNLKGVVLKDSEGKEKTVYKQLYEGSDAVYYTVNEGNTIITLKNVKAGTYTVSLSANYYDALATEAFTVGRTTPLAKAPTVAKHEKKEKKKDDLLEKVDYYRLTFNDMNANELDAYLNAVTRVTVGDTVYTKENVYFDENNYRVKTVKDTQSILKDCLDLAANGINAANGTAITVEATGYETMTYPLKDGNTPIDPEPGTPEIKAAPQVAVVAHKEKGTIDEVGWYRLTFKGMSAADELSSYLQAITDVTVGQNTYTQSGVFFQADKYNIGGSGYSGYDYLDLADNAFDKEGKTTVTIKADGYQILTFEYDAKNPIKADAPEVAEVAKKDDTTYRMTFKNSMPAVELKAYLNAISSVTVGGKDYTKAAYSLSKNKYLLVDSSKTYGSNYDCIDFYANEGFAESGTTTITLKADGYADLQFTYTPASSGGSGGGTTGPDSGSGKDDNTEEAKYKVSSCELVDGHYRLMFDGFSESELKSFLGNITEVKVGENTYEELSLVWGDSKYHKAESKGQGIDCLELSANGFNASGETEIIIKGTVDGKEVTITYKANK